MAFDVEQSLMCGSTGDLATHFRSRRLSVEEAVGWYLARIAAFNQSGPAINAVREVSARAIDDARSADKALATGCRLGPLHGIPVLLKDNILTADGMAATAGAAALVGFRPRHEATLVRRLRRAGAIILGKTNLTEFADYVSDVMPSGFSGAGGVVRNPHGGKYGRGQGSSVGSAASVAASFAMVAIGTETQNSIQTPAAYSSVVGYKPSVGRVDRSGVFPLVPSQDSPGALARNVQDAALVAAIMAADDLGEVAAHSVGQDLTGGDPNAHLSGVRIGVPRRQIANRPEFAHLMPMFEDCLSRLSKAGAVLTDPCDLPSAHEIQDLRSSVFRVEFKASLNTFLQDNDAPCAVGSLRDLIGWNEAHPDAIPYGQSLLIAADATVGLSDPIYLADRARDLALSRSGGIDAALSLHDADVLLAPMGAAAKCTGKAGAPVVTIPVGRDATGVPFGVSLFTSFEGDSRLLAIAALIENVIAARQMPLLSG
jgi:amidase